MKLTEFKKLIREEVRKVLSEAKADPALPIGMVLRPADERKSSIDLYDLQHVVYYTNSGVPVLTKVRFRRNSSGSNVWSPKEWDGGSNEIPEVLKRFIPITEKEYDAIVKRTKYMADWEIEAYTTKEKQKQKLVFKK